MLHSHGTARHLLWNVGPDVPAFSGRRARRVLREGEACDAEVVGIEVEGSASGDTVEPEYRRRGRNSGPRCREIAGVLARLGRFHGSRSHNPRGPIEDPNARTPAGAGVLGVELGGLEPPTSWVRSKALTA
jgi:hypothetical protein